MSNTYVKKYDVGQIKLDLPYANYIHELPLLSFGDVQHTVNLSLVFNYERHFEEDNFFHISNGFKLNLQKRIGIDPTTNIPIVFQEESGKLVSLIDNGNNIYAFDDKSQRIIRKTNYGYDLEYPDSSKELYTLDGNIISTFDKYKPSSNILYYRYYDNKLSSIQYRSSKTIYFEYDDDDKLSKITYAGKEIEFYYGNNALTIKDISGTFFKYEYSDHSYRVYSTETKESNVSICEKLYEYSSDNYTVTITDKVGDEIVNQTEYRYGVSNISSAITPYCVDIKNMNGVTNRIYFDGEEPLYSHEVGLENDGFFNNQYFTGDINIYRTLSCTDDEKYQGVRKYADSQPMCYTQSDSRQEWSCGSQRIGDTAGYHIVSGWIKFFPPSYSIYDAPFSIANSINHTPIYTFNVNLLQNQEWQYFSYKFDTDISEIEIFTNLPDSILLTRDFRLSFQPTELLDEKYTTDMFLTKNVIVNENFNEEHVIPLAECRFFNGSTEIDGSITLNDLLRYKINQMYGTNKNEIYLNNCRGVIANAGEFKIQYSKNDSDYTVPVTSLAIGTKTFSHHITNLTKSNFYTDDNNQPYFSTKYYSNGNCYKEDIYDDNLDIISSRVEGVTTTYQRNAKGLITTKTSSAPGISTPITQTISYDSSNSKVLRTTDEFGVTTAYETDDTWGIVTKITVNGNTILINEYDANNVALVGKSFADGDTARKNTIGYSNGRMTSLQSDTLSYTFDNSFKDNTKDELVCVSKNSNSIEHQIYTDTDNGTIVTSKYPSDSTPLQTSVTNVDKYGRVAKVEGIYSNTYDVLPYWYYWVENDINPIKTMDTYDRNTHGELERTVMGIDNKDGALAQTDDLITGEITKYGYTNDNLTAAITYSSNDSNDSIIKHETFVYDNANRLTTDMCIYDTAKNKSVKSVIEYTYPETHPLADSRINKYSYYLNGDTSPTVQTENEFDGFNRVITKYQSIYGNEFVKDIGYDKTRPETLYESFNGSVFSEINYRYDAMGRIKFIDNGESSITYTYDNYGQLAKEVNNTLDKSFQYEYNGIGNITSVITTPTNGSAYTTAFTYGDNTHPDRLTAFDGKAITYNSMGCPVSYDSKTYTWTRGKLSKISYGSLTSGNHTHNFTYNALGQRVEKSYSYFKKNTASGGFGEAAVTYTTSKNTKYYYDHGGRLIAEYCVENFSDFTQESTRLEYLYDESGMIGFKYYASGVDMGAYYYQRNLQGDVIAIYNTDGVKQVEYAYDAYGNCNIINGITSDIAYINPIRYRGYYWDSETGWYFLNARYYSPEWRRFISPDDTNYLDLESVNGLNLYCYCNNDPINFVDPSGHMPNWLKWLIGGVAFAGAVVLTAVSGGALAPVFIGMGASILTGGLIEGTISAFTGGSFGDGFLNGAANGAMWGGIFALGGSSIRYIRYVHAVKTNNFDSLAKLFTHNKFSSKVMLGKYDGGGPTSYIAKAGYTHTYFKMPSRIFNKLVLRYGDDIWMINQSFLNQQIGKTFYFSHPIENATGYFLREVQYLKSLGII